MDLFLSELDFAVLAGDTSANRRANSVDLLATAVVVFAIFRTIATVLVDFEAVDFNVLLLKCLPINGLCLVDNKVASLLKIFSVEAISASATGSTVTEFFET